VELRIPVSFRRKKDKELYDHVKTKFCASAYIKELIKADMEKKKEKKDIFNF